MRRWFSSLSSAASKYRKPGPATSRPGRTGIGSDAGRPFALGRFLSGRPCASPTIKRHAEESREGLGPMVCR
jgi:hypothetical protein